MKILLFAGRFEVRGSSAYTLRLARHLPELGMAPRIITPDARLVEAQQRASLHISEYPQIQVPLWGRVVMELMCRDLLANPPDLIHVQSRGVLPHGMWLAQHLKCPFVLTVHDYLPVRERLRWDPVWGRRIVAVSESVRDALLEHGGVPADLVTVIHSGVDAPEELHLPPVLDPGHTPVVGTASPLEAVKGLPFFLGAARKVLAAREDVQFLVAGAGPEEGNLRRLARELGVGDRVTFVPNMFDFTHALRAMDVFVLSSLQQGLGTIMLEAMGLSRPVIATGVGGVHSVVRDGETGLVVPPKDSGRLAERILELLDDPVRARAVGESGRQHVREQFNVEKMVRETAQVYREVLAEVPAGVAATGIEERGSKVEDR